MPPTPQLAQDGSSPAGATRSRSLLALFVLVFLLAIPFWVIGVTGRPLTPDLPLSALQFVCLAMAAALHVFRESGPAGVSTLRDEPGDES